MDAPVLEVRTEGEPAVAEELGQNVDQIIVKVDEVRFLLLNLPVVKFSQFIAPEKVKLHLPFFSTSHV